MAPNKTKPMKSQIKYWDLSKLESEIMKYTDDGIIHHSQFKEQAQKQINSLSQQLSSTTHELNKITDVLEALVEGNEEVQRQLIKISPHHIAHISRPYVTIQIEAINADPDSFHSIISPSQEAVDTYRIVR